MARPKRCRRICTEPDFDAFAPAGIPCAETVTLTLEEYETIRLIDLESAVCTTDGYLPHNSNGTL